MTALWTRAEAAAATGGRPAGPDWRASGVAIDSRKVRPGDLFVALPGARTDGHDHAGAALAGGAAAAMVERIPPGAAAAAPLLLVEDCLAALARLGAAARARSRAGVVAVTGSVGKTGTKESLARALAPFGAVHASEGNLNNHIGAPLSLARLPAGAGFAVLEMGMNHAGEIAPLSRMARPDVAIVTNVEAVHIAHFADERGIAEAKAEVFAGLAPGGAAVLNRDNPWFDLLAARAAGAGAGRIVGFGRGAAAEVRLLDAAPDDGGVSVRASVGGREVRYRLDAIGEHWAFNSAGVLACVHALGLDPEPAAAAIRQVVAGRGRGGQARIALAGGGAVTLIDESYNASPAAMRAAFRVLAAAAPGPGGRRIAVLGDMLELGAAGPELHAALAGDLLAARPDAVFTVGPEMRALRARLPAALRAGHADSSAGIAGRAAAGLRDGDVVLVKGSLGTRMAPVVAAIEALAEPPRLAANGR